jgi:DNA-binding NtrC family response regulator
VRAGVFELADHGTLFLDEIAEMPVGLQSKLLRVLEDRRVRRIGGERELSIDARVVSATNADVTRKLAGAGFREDLYFRLNVFNLHIPPLRDRREDIPLLAQAFLEDYAGENEKQIAGFSEEAMQELLRHPWPGNVRELRNTIQRAVILSRDSEIQAADLPPSVRASSGMRPGQYRPGDPFPAARTQGQPARPDPGIAFPVGSSLDEVERLVILRTLEAYGDNKTRAAAVLGISAKTLHTKLNRYGVREEGRSPREALDRRSGP